MKVLAMRFWWGFSAFSVWKHSDFVIAAGTAALAAKLHEVNHVFAWPALAGNEVPAHGVGGSISQVSGSVSDEAAGLEPDFE